MLSTVNAMPPHGLLVFYGQSVLNKATGEVSRLRRTLTPPQPVQEFKYDVSKTFSTHSLHQLLISQEGGVGYIVIDGSAVALGTLSENGLKVHHHENVDIPKKHGRGGQSAPRFQRIRLEKRQLLVKKVIALSEDYFLNENKATVQVQALVVGGPGQLKDQLVERLPQLLKSA
ncbi:eukaryotic peptide chain release factor subunit 1-1-like, partial [Homarus americanus]|uniref:eukaryotic peptide chain release factor subunit 1-1-like n=1 Tax=Homarus americanus TaxID=6706 RepID=UPI001C452C7C